MSTYEVLDTYPSFERFWSSARSLPVEQQVDRWASDYLADWPELLRMQVANYRESSADWRNVARRRVFPQFDDHLPRMREVHDRLRRAIPVATRRVRSRFGWTTPVTFVLHVGIGCGAGWATTFRGTPSVLFGLENAAELGWNDRETVVALVEHELAHLMHDEWRRGAGLGGRDRHRGPWWRLFEEGFATRCELLLGGIGAHHSVTPSEGWLAWCEENRARLASRFLAATKSARLTQRFFGSWYEIEGHIETGYYLGAEVIREWERMVPLREIACWTAGDIRRRARASLTRMVKGRGPGPPPRISAGSGSHRPRRTGRGGP